MNPFKTIREIITGKTAEETFEIEIVEACLVAGIDRQPGERLNVSPNTAQNLCASGRAKRILTDEDSAKADRLRALIPPPWTAAPLPETWRALPAPFHELWTIKETFRCARGRAQEIEALYLRGRGLTDAERLQLEGESGRLAPDGSTRSNILENWIHERMRSPLKIEVGDSRLEGLRRLRDALDRANEGIQENSRVHSENYRRLLVICGDTVLEQVARGRHAAKESAQLGFEIFAERLAALQLGDAKLRSLFDGTREQSEYCHQKPSPPNLRIAWTDPTTGEARHYCDGDPVQLAGWHAMFATRADELEASAKAARAELVRTRKASKAAA